jgi:hypothetical protein
MRHAVARPYTLYFPSPLGEVQRLTSPHIFPFERFARELRHIAEQFARVGLFFVLRQLGRLVMVYLVILR